MATYGIEIRDAAGDITMGMSHRTPKIVYQQAYAWPPGNVTYFDILTGLYIHSGNAAALTSSSAFCSIPSTGTVRVFWGPEVAYAATLTVYRF